MSKNLILFLLILMAKGSFAQTTERVRAYSMHRATNVSASRLVDSTVYIYSAGKGSGMSVNENLYFFMDFGRLEATILYDSFLTYQDTGNGIEHTYFSVREYDSKDKMQATTFYYVLPTGVQHGDRNVLTRDTSGKVTKLDYYVPGENVPFVLYNSTGYFYNTKNELITDSSCHDTYYCSMNKYSYNSNGQLEEKIILGNSGGRPFDSFERHTYNYYPDGKNRSIFISYYKSSTNTWDSKDIDSFIYSGSNDFKIRYWLHRDAQLNIPVITGREITLYNNLGNPYLISSESWDKYNKKWKIFTDDTLIYDTKGRLTRLINKRYSPGYIPSLTTLTYNIYYEPINNASIQATKSAQQGLSVYPNPAKEYVYVTLDDPARGGLIHIRNMFGQIVCTAAYQPHQQQIKLGMGGLPPGNYFATDTNRDGVHGSIILLP